MVWSDLLTVLQKLNFWSDFIEIDRVLIEANYCTECKTRTFVYKGFSLASEYRAFGVCESCDFAKLFWIEPAKVSGFKRKVSKRKAKAAI